MMNHMMKAAAIVEAQALVSVCAISRVVDAESGGHLNQDYKGS